MKKKTALLALLLAGAMSFGVAMNAGCKREENPNEGENPGITDPSKDPNKDPDDPNKDPDDPNKDPDDPNKDPNEDDPNKDPGDDTPEPTPGASYEVKFVSNGKEVDVKTVESGTKVNAPAVTSDDGTYFGGWYSNSQCTGTAFDFSKPISGHVTLYAKWVTLDASITYSYAGEESAAFEWKDTNAAGAKVAYKLSSEETYKDVDSQLIRKEDGNTVRVDIVGLKGNEKYDFKITTSAGTDMTVSEMPISAYDRSGYAHFKYTDGIGAYNDDGTLKDNAIVIYVTEENKDTVMRDHSSALIKAQMFDIPYTSGITGATTNWNKKAEGIGWWLNNVQYTKKDAKSGKINSNTYSATGSTLGFGNAAFDNIPVVIRFIGTVTTPEGCTAYDSLGEGGSVGDNGHMARMKNLKNITLEGIGEDAEIKGWGFHFMAGSDAKNGRGKGFEVRNLTFNEYPEDAVGMEGVQSGSTITGSVERCWIHNNTFLPGRCDSPAESDKKEGDGSCDFKRGMYFTCSYNYFEYCHKTNLVGSSDSSLQFNMTYHHNMWYQCGSRIPLTRQANVHFYNNYVCYDANEKTTPYSHISKPAGSYVHSLRANCYIFSEANYYEGSKNVTDGKSGGTGKAWNNMYYANFGTNTLVEAKTREEKVSNNCSYNGTDYSTFDTNSTLFYYDATNKKSDCALTDAATARKDVLQKVGVQGFTPRVEANHITDANRPEAALNIPEDGLTIDLSKIANNTTVSGVKFINAKTNSGVVKGRGLVATFTLAQRADISLSSGTTGDTALELLKSDGTVIAGKISTFVGTLEAGTYLIYTGQKDKDGSLASLSFKSGVSDAEKVQDVIAYINAIGTVELTEACKEKIDTARSAYNAIGAELQKQVTNADKLTQAISQYNNLAVAPVIKAIDDIGTVNADSGMKITAARTAYNALNAEQKALVTNYATLTAAEKTYESFEVEGINKQIAALAAPATATTEAEIEDLLDKYQAVQVMYADLDEDQKADVTGYSKVTEGIAALGKALQPYEVKHMIADLPETTAADYYTKVGELKAAYEALDANGKALITSAEKTIYDAAVEKYTEYASQAKVAIFTKSNTTLASDAGFTVNGKKGYKGTSQTFTYDGKEYNSPLKLQSGDTITFSTSTKMTVKMFLHLDGKQTILIDGTKYTAENGFITAVVEAGNHVIGRDTEAWLCYVELLPAA